jgi:hypothetical protein
MTEADMTEVEWLGCDRAQPMIGFLLASKASQRKLRLFACACCRRIWYQFKKSEPSRVGIEVAERYADGQATEEELTAAYEGARRAYNARSAYGPGQARQAATYATAPKIDGVYFISGSVSSGIARSLWSDREGELAESRVHPRLLRCVFGNPFRPILAERAWLTGTVTTLAAAAYQERSLPSGEIDPVRLAVLGDALEEAGCTNPTLLAHLRSEGPHVRGCWMLDLLLAKEEHKSRTIRCSRPATRRTARRASTPPPA